ncbi:MAG: hypothetical protein CBC35_07115 [Planctomycetes bacterium TMED75]|nr:hypothetical protein [Planctomycetaceae bacterium]OUU92474.1 MAG: hypothetical protein CBC35_07115 [Planctomycetes bacterium TMED75]
MRMHVLTLCIPLIAGAALQADAINDPFKLETHQITSQVSYFVYDAQNSESFTPASHSWESSGSMVGFQDCASMKVINEAADRELGRAGATDQILFEWSNLNLHSIFGFTAAGEATTSFSLQKNASLTMSQIANIGSLSAQASWSIKLFDESSQLLGDLNQIGDSYELEAEKTYRLAFEMGGSDTRSTSGNLIRWGLGIEYNKAPPAVVPGFGGLALFTSCGLRRRRRRK